VEISEATLGNGGGKFGKLRVKNGLAEFALRVIVSGSGSIDPSANIFEKRFSPIIVLTTMRASKQNLAELGRRADEVTICGESEVDFRRALVWLTREFGVKRLLCEGGGELNDALFRADLVDEIHLTICPKIFGGSTAPTISDGKGFNKLALTRKFKLSSARQEKSELFTTFSRKM
jgi:riboflavin-specific deaminase-like protein